MTLLRNHQEQLSGNRVHRYDYAAAFAAASLFNNIVLNLAEFFYVFGPEFEVPRAGGFEAVVDVIDVFYTGGL